MAEICQFPQLDGFHLFALFSGSSEDIFISNPFNPAYPQHVSVQPHFEGLWFFHYTLSQRTFHSGDLSVLRSENLSGLIWNLRLRSPQQGTLEA